MAGAAGRKQREPVQLARDLCPCCWTGAGSSVTDMPTGPLRRDVTALPDLLHGRSRAGPVRQERPVYVDLLPPCNAGCPAGENIQAWLAHAETGESRGRVAAAGRRQPDCRPFTGGSATTRARASATAASLDSAVSIHAVERFLGDLALERGWSFGPPSVRSGRRVLVIGAGPSGLSAAYHLARLGHEVEIRDAGDEPGGMMRYGIPAYRMPRDVLDGELDRIAAMGVRITLGHRVEDLDAERREGGFDAVFVAVGAHLSKRVDIPARDAGRIVDAVSFLRSVASGERPVIGRRVAVYGGGNTAMDAARVARRLGANDALIVYRRTRAQMPAHAEEAQEAEREGVRINWLRTITAFDGPGADGGGHGARRERIPAADRAVRDAGRGHRDPGPRPGHRHRVPAPGTRRGVRAGRHGAGVGVDDDRLPGRVRGRGHGAGRAHRDGRGGARQEGSPEHRRLAAREARRRLRPSTERRLVRHAESVVFRRRRPPAAAGGSSRRSGSRTSARCSAGCPSGRRSTRPAVACRAGTASSATAASGRARKTR